MDPDPGGPKTCGSRSPTLFVTCLSCYVSIYCICELYLRGLRSNAVSDHRHTVLGLHSVYSFSVHYFLRNIYIIFQKYKTIKKSQNSRNQGFSYYFCLIIIGAGAGSRRSKNIRIRIRNRVEGYPGSFLASVQHREIFWFPRNLSNHMDRQARTRDTVLAKSREMTGRIRSQTKHCRGGWVGKR
jgi:hypothetical protein